MKFIFEFSRALHYVRTVRAKAFKVALRATAHTMKTVEKILPMLETYPLETGSLEILLISVVADFSSSSTYFLNYQLLCDDDNLDLTVTVRLCSGNL